MEYFAICTRCKNSVLLKKWQSGRYSCQVCGENFGEAPNKKMGFLVDSDLANQAYTAGQEYFDNADFGQAIKYFEKTLQFNPNHYLAVYFSHMCHIYEEEKSAEFDIVDHVACALTDSVEKVINARVDLPKRLSFLTLIYSQCYIIISKHYNRLQKALSDEQDWSTLRKLSLEFSLSIKKIIDIDKEAIMAHNPSMSLNCVGIADIGISACQNVIAPKIIENQFFEHDLDLPARSQAAKAKALCSSFMSYAQSLNAAFVHSTKTDISSVLVYIDKNILPLRERYYNNNAVFTSKFLSHRRDLFEKLSSASAFAAKYAHSVCYSDLFNDKGDKQREHLIFESVDNCLDSLMPRIQLIGNNRVEIFIMELKDFGIIADYLNDFLDELMQYNKAYAVKRVYSFFRYVYDGLKKSYESMQKKYNKRMSRIKDDTMYKRELSWYLNYLYQLATSCALTAVISDIDIIVMGNVRDKMLQLGLEASQEFEKMSNYHVTNITELERFSGFYDIFNLIKQACGIEDSNSLNQKNAQKKEKKKVV
ncbi:MAG: hypothetical protein LBU60_03075 [Clostridiales bacterium]|jgi:hypothetical protein|nr:hypothetical protein [Clostridiales bacterium]